MKPVVFIPEPIAASGIDLLPDQCEIVALWRDGDAVSDDRLRSLFYEADAAITRLFRVGADDIERCRNLKVIARHGVGVDMVDCQAATARGIPVLYTPGANSRSVAEHTIALIMALARQIGPAWQAVLGGRFDQRTSFEGIELAGKTLGLIGIGQVGRRVAEIAAQGLKMDVRGYDPILEKDSYEGSASLEDSLEAVLRRADFLSLHVPLSPQTKHMLREKHLRQLKSGCRGMPSTLKSCDEKVTPQAGGPVSFRHACGQGRILDLTACGKSPSPQEWVQSPIFVVYPILETKLLRKRKSWQSPFFTEPNCYRALPSQG